MTSVEQHKIQVKEHMQELADAIAIGLENRPATLALHVSACSISLLEMYLHVLGKISTGTTIKHDWFKRPKEGQKITPLAERKLGALFPEKEKILSLLYIIEENRNKLIYGKPTKVASDAVYSSFQQLHELIKEKLKEQGVDIE
ncbi:MAG: hypothetical protein AABX82_04155 [Nanoarchaeota archaeon]